MANEPAKILQAVKQAIREPYAWPGGYPKYVAMDDGEVLSIDAAKSEFRSICRSTLQRSRDGWGAAGVDINWEDGALFCAHTGERIPSAYAEDDETNATKGN